MTRIPYIVMAFTMSTYALKDDKPQNWIPSEVVAADQPEGQEVKKITFYLTDTSKNEYPFVRVRMTLGDKDANYRIEWGNETRTWTGDLMALTEGQAYRTPPEVLWYNRHYACLMTNHTGPFSQHLFLPLREGLDHKFFRHTITYMDSTDNFVCFIRDHDFDNELGSVEWGITNLLTGTSGSFETTICGSSFGYPWYSKMYRNGRTLAIEPQCDKEGVKHIDITKYCAR